MNFKTVQEELAKSIPDSEIADRLELFEAHYGLNCVSIAVGPDKR
jgi:hypothetical protein